MLPSEIQASIAITCIDCRQVFAVSADEQRFLGERARATGKPWHLPRRCLSCRFAARKARFAPPVVPDQADEQRTCIDCGAAFLFGGRDREYFARRGWTAPKRCRPCRTWRSSQAEI